MARPNRFDGMMLESCVELGWCGSVKGAQRRHVTDFIPEAGPVSAEQFVEWLIRADGFESDQLSASQIERWMLQLRAVFVRHMGADVVDASVLRSNYRGT